MKGRFFVEEDDSEERDSMESRRSESEPGIIGGTHYEQQRIQRRKQEG